LSEKSAVSTPEKRAEQKIKTDMTTSRMARVTGDISYIATARLAARSQPRESGSVVVPRRNWCVLVCSLSEPRAN